METQMKAEKPKFNLNRYTQKVWRIILLGLHSCPKENIWSSFWVMIQSIIINYFGQWNFSQERAVQFLDLWYEGLVGALKDVLPRDADHIKIAEHVQAQADAVKNDKKELVNVQ